MKNKTNDIDRLCRETNLNYEDAAALLRQFGGDFRRALRAWQDQRSIFIDPVSVDDCARPVLDYVRQAWRSCLRTARKLPSPLVRVIALVALSLLLRRAGGWLMLLVMIVRCAPMLISLLKPLLHRTKYTAAHFVL